MRCDDPVFLTVMSEDIEIMLRRRYLMNFCETMMTELEANVGKGSVIEWATCDPGKMMNEVMYHVAKALYAMKDRRAKDAREHFADIANCAIIASVAYKDGEDIVYGDTKRR